MLVFVWALSFASELRKTIARMSSCTLKSLGTCSLCNPKPNGCYVRNSGSVQHRPAGCPCAGPRGGLRPASARSAPEDVLVPGSDDELQHLDGEASSSSDGDGQPARHVGFSDDKRFHAHGVSLPEPLEKRALVLASKYEFTDLSLWRSFLCFFGFLASSQPLALIHVNLTVGVRRVGVRTVGFWTVGVRTVGVRIVGVQMVGVRTAGIRTVGVRTVGVQLVSGRLVFGRLASGWVVSGLLAFGRLVLVIGRVSICVC